VPALSAEDTSYVYLTLFADGVFIYANIENRKVAATADGNGVEYGAYDYDADDRLVLDHAARRRHERPLRRLGNGARFGRRHAQR
jgi:hypothetical protein